MQNSLQEVMEPIPNDKDTATSLHIGPDVICDSVETINIKNHFVCFSCDKRNPVILTLSNIFSFVFGSFLDSICCCITSLSQRALITAVLTVLVVSAITAGLIGRIYGVHF